MSKRRKTWASQFSPTFCVARAKHRLEANFALLDLRTTCILLLSPSDCLCSKSNLVSWTAGIGASLLSSLFVFEACFFPADCFCGDGYTQKNISLKMNGN
jgi:hypothetical protein